MALNKIGKIIWKYLFPSMNTEVRTALDRQSMRGICNVNLAACIFESLSIFIFLVMNNWRIDSNNIVVLYSVGFCAVFSLLVFLVSRKMMKNKELSHFSSLVFKIFFFVVYTLWAIHADMRHYVVGDQMLTFYIVQLLVTCFILLEPMISIVLVIAAYSTLYAVAYSVKNAAGIDVFNFVLLAILSAVGMCVQYHTRLYLAKKEERLEEVSRRDALTGLRNRLALEEDATTFCKSAVTAYMIDIDYFKQINDNYGHAMGDEILRKTADLFQELYPDALYYRYGGDEFLVLSKGDGSDNFLGEEYGFVNPNLNGPSYISLSIGIAKGEPQDYDEVFALISRADKALYDVKARSHSPEQGGYDRRRRR